MCAQSEGQIKCMEKLVWRAHSGDKMCSQDARPGHLGIVTDHCATLSTAFSIQRFHVHLNANVIQFKVCAHSNEEWRKSNERDKRTETVPGRWLYGTIKWIFILKCTRFMHLICKLIIRIGLSQRNARLLAAHGMQSVRVCVCWHPNVTAEPATSYSERADRQGDSRAECISREWWIDDEMRVV